MDDRELKRYFAGRLPERIAGLAAARDAARSAGWAGEPLRDFHRLAHSLAGTAATFGFPEAAGLARRIEDLLDAAREAGAPPGDAALLEIDDLLARLRELAGQPVRE